MLQALKARFSHVERSMAKALPPEILAYVLPIRFRFIRHYFPSAKLSGNKNRQKAVRYVDRICMRRKDIGEVFARDRQFRQSGREGPLTSELSENTLRKLLAQPQARLLEPATIMNQFGHFRVAAVFRAFLLLRVAMDNISSGQDQEAQHDLVLIEIAENDFCKAVLDRSNVIEGSARNRLEQQLHDASRWGIARKVSVFMQDDPDPKDPRELAIHGKSVMLQGPSKRPSDLAEMTTDLTAVVGYAGPSSLVRPVDLVDVSLYVVPKLRQLHQEDRLEVLKDVELPVISCVNEPSRAFSIQTVSCYNPTYANIHFENLASRTNGGVRLFLWLIKAGASRLFVTNFDMFTNRDLPSGYISDRPEDLRERDIDTFRVKKDTMAADFSRHHPSQQYAIYKSFKKYDEVVYDSVLTNILSAPLSSYINELEALYGADSYP